VQEKLLLKPCDIIVIGAGLAGIKAAYEAALSGLSTRIIVKSRLCSGSSFYPKMDSLGCQCTSDDPMDEQYFFEEMEDSGLTMNSPSLTKVYVENIRERIGDFDKLGIPYHKLQDKKIACFAKRPRDIYVWGDWDGIRTNVRELFAAFPNVEILENTDVVGILQQGGRVKGVLAVGSDGNLLRMSAKSVILATGGYGSIYEHSLNTSDVSGDGQMLAYNAGAKLINLEFIQFIPGFLSPVYKIILREPMLLHCKGLPDADGRELLSEYLSSDQEIESCMQQRSTHGPFTCRTAAKYFDIAIMEEILKSEETKGVQIKYEHSLYEDEREVVRMHLEWLREKYRIDPCRDKTFVAPFCHAANGGVKVDEHCSTTVAGLFAAGEVAGGIHGADRHGGNATGSCIVFGTIAGRSAVAYAQGADIPPSPTEAEQEEYISTVYRGGTGELTPAQASAEVKRVMWRNGNIIRSETGLATALEQVEQVEANFDPMRYIANPSQLKQAVNTVNTIRLAKLVLGAMRGRRESRGSHYRTDYPALDHNYDNLRIEVTKQGNLADYSLQERR